MLRFCDSFEHYDSTVISNNSKWSSASNLFFFSNGGLVSGRFGGSAANLVGYANRSARKRLDSQPTWIMGIAWKDTGTFTGQGHLFELLDSGTRQVDLGFNTSGQLVVTRNGTTLGTTSAAFVQNRWYYIEWKVTIHNSTGAVEVRVDGATVLNLTSQDTQNTANASANDVQVGQHDGAFASIAVIDDFYVCDGVDSGVSGAPNDDFLGDVIVPAIFPNGNGNYSDFVGSDSNSVNNYLLVDENPENGDTDYVESSNVGDQDTYTYGNLASTTGSVFGVQILPYARKTDAGARKIKTLARLSGTDDAGPDQTLSADYVYLSDIREADPSGSQWTIANVNSAEFGEEVAA